MTRLAVLVRLCQTSSSPQSACLSVVEGVVLVCRSYADGRFSNIKTHGRCGARVVPSLTPSRPTPSAPDLRGGGIERESIVRIPCEGPIQPIQALLKRLYSMKQYLCSRGLETVCQFADITSSTYCICLVLEGTAAELLWSGSQKYHFIILQPMPVIHDLSQAIWGNLQCQAVQNGRGPSSLCRPCSR